MSAPKIIIQIAIAGAQIFGKALVAAGRQAVKNAQHRPQGGVDVAGMSNATSGSVTDRLTREHRMTLDEAQSILNVKPGTPMEKILQNYEHLFKTNSPPEPTPPPSGKTPASKRAAQKFHSHYLQSKVYRARERIEAEAKIPEEKLESQAEAAQSASSSSSNPPPPESKA